MHDIPCLNVPHQYRNRLKHQSNEQFLPDAYIEKCYKDSMKSRYDILYHLGVINNEEQLYSEENAFECA